MSVIDGQIGCENREYRARAENSVEDDDCKTTAEQPHTEQVEGAQGKPQDGKDRKNLKLLNPFAEH